MPTHILIGPPGAGKSTVGKALARHIGVAFVDSDNLVEAKNITKRIHTKNT